MTSFQFMLFPGFQFMLFPGTPLWQATGRGKPEKHILLRIFKFQQVREEPDSGWILERLQPNVTEDGWRILDFLDVLLREHVRNHNIEKMCARSWNAAWQTWYDLESFPSITSIFSVLIRLDETVRRLLVRTGLSENEPAVKLVQVVHLFPGHPRRTWTRPAGLAVAGRRPSYPSHIRVESLSFLRPLPRHTLSLRSSFKFVIASIS